VPDQAERGLDVRVGFPHLLLTKQGRHTLANTFLPSFLNNAGCSVADPDPDPLVRGTDPGPSIIQQKFLLFCDIFYDFLSLKNDVNVPSKSFHQKNLEIIFFFAFFKVTDENSRIRIY
jgi:hypothetical protein